MLEWIKKNRKELLLPSLCFVLGLLLSISTIQVQEQDTDISRKIEPSPVSSPKTTKIW